MTSLPMYFLCELAYCYGIIRNRSQAGKNHKKPNKAFACAHFQGVLRGEEIPSMRIFYLTVLGVNVGVGTELLTRYTRVPWAQRLVHSCVLGDKVRESRGFHEGL